MGLRAAGRRGRARAALRPRRRPLRDRLSPNTLLAYHLSVWGTKADLLLQDPPLSEVDRLARSAAAFYRSLGVRFDLAFAEFNDRGAGFERVQNGDGGRSWWRPADDARFVRFLRGFVAGSGLRVALWQIPLGNTKLPDTFGRFRDNRVELLLAPDRKLLRRYADAGVVALLFGGGAEGTTSRTTDGGLFDRRVRAYYARGPLHLPAR